MRRSGLLAEREGEKESIGPRKLGEHRRKKRQVKTEKTKHTAGYTAFVFVY